MSNSHNGVEQVRRPFAIPVTRRSRQLLSPSSEQRPTYQGGFGSAAAFLGGVMLTLLIGVAMATAMQGGIRVPAAKSNSPLPMVQVAERNHDQNVIRAEGVQNRPAADVPPVNHATPSHAAVSVPNADSTATVVASAAVVSRDAPSTPPAQHKTLIHATAIAGTPLGVGKIEVIFGDGECPTWYPDQPLNIEEAAGRLRYPAIEVEYQVDTDGKTDTLRRLMVHFLFLRDDELSLQVQTRDAAWVQARTINPSHDQQQHRDLLNSWWKAYESSAKELVGVPHVLRQLTRRVLARRLGFEVPPYPKSSFRQRPMAALESQFERSISTLLGIDSLLLAMPDAASAESDEVADDAMLELPRSMNLPVVQVPRQTSYAAPEPLAMRVPEDCFYARCGKLGNYAWLRHFVAGWGGNLQEIVSLPSLDYSVRHHLERQLAIDLKSSQDQMLDRTISDMALIGHDLFFREGATVGVLFQASDPRGLERILRNQREAAARGNPATERRVIHVDGHPVWSLTTADNSVRSFYTIDGDHQLVTNSLQLTRKFLATRNGQQSLGRLAEYRYLRSQLAQSKSSCVMIYLSDPFFRQLASPHYRVELGRRARSVAELNELAVAVMAAESEGRDATTVNGLIEIGYLPSSFGQRSDGSRPMLDGGGEVVDSLRGRRGSFLPISDVKIDRVTAGEQADYHAFARRYQQQWRQVDPLAVTLSPQDRAADGTQRVEMTICVTPYARQRYAFLTRHLTPATTRHIHRLKSDVLSVDSELRDTQGRVFQVHMGLLDQPVEFRIVKGNIERDGTPGGASFGSSNKYVAVNPGGTEGLELVQRFVNDLQCGPTTATSTPSGSSINPLAAVLTSLFDARLARLLGIMLTAQSVSTERGWTVYAPDLDIRQRVLPALRFTTASQPAQIRLAISDPNSTSVANYLHAYAYVESRKESARTASMLNDLAQQWGTDPLESERVVARLFGAQPICPLGKRFELAKTPRGQYWQSPAWRENSVRLLKDVPADYRFPFLDWLRGGDIQFSLSRDTLRAVCELQVRTGVTDAVERSPLADSAPSGKEVATTTSLKPPISTQPIAAGDRIVVISDRADLKLGTRRLAQFPRDAELTVVSVRGSWIGVWGSYGGRTVRGWVRRQDVARR